MTELRLIQLVTLPHPNMSECRYCDDVNFGFQENPAILSHWVSHYRTKHQQAYTDIVNGRVPPVDKHGLPYEDVTQGNIAMTKAEAEAKVWGLVDEMPPADLPMILLGTMVRNDAINIPNWWKCLNRTTYPKDKIKIHIIEDNSDDETMPLLVKLQKESQFAEFELVNSEGLPQVKYRTDKKAKPEEVDGGFKFTRLNELNAWYNEVWFGMIKAGVADLFTQIHTDILTHPDTLKHHVALSEYFPDCGNPGSNGVARGGVMGGAPWLWKVPNPIGFYNEAQRSQQFGGGLVRPMTATEMRYLSPIITGAFCGGVFSITKEVINGGAKYGVWAEETMTPFAVGMLKLGKRCYVDTTTQFIHCGHQGEQYVGPLYDGWWAKA